MIENSIAFTVDFYKNILVLENKNCEFKHLAAVNKKTENIANQK